MTCRSCGWRFIRSFFLSSKHEAEVKSSPLPLLEIWETQDVFKKICNTCLKIGATKDNIDNMKHCLLNPANQNFEGTKRSYVCVGGPILNKNLDISSSWGGMEAGSLMRYPTQAIDGRVHLEGGPDMLMEIRKIGLQTPAPLCTAIITPATGRLSSAHGFDHIVHSAVPLVSHIKTDPDAGFGILKACYVEAFEIVAKESNSGFVTIAVPLIGTGTGGFCSHLSARAAADAVFQLHSKSIVMFSSVVLRFFANDANGVMALTEAFEKMTEQGYSK